MPDLTDLYAIEVDIDAETAEGEDAKPEAERFRVDGPETATWALRKLAAAEAEIDDAKTLAASEIARVEQWYDEVTRRPARDVEFFRGLLIDYMRSRHAEDPKCKTVKLPAGTLTARAGQPKIDATDIEALKAYADTLDDEYRSSIIRTKYEANVSGMKGLLVPKDEGDPLGAPLVDPSTGEVVPGVVWLPAVVKYDAKTTEGES